MESIKNMNSTWIESIKQRYQVMKQKESQKNLESSYKCEICKDKEYIFVDDAVKFCKCRDIRLAKERLEKSGIADRVEKNTFKTYQVRNEPQNTARNICIKYIQDFDREKSLLLQGQVGSGKTHLAIATCNKLLEKYAVKYMSYTKDINELKFNMTDTDFYNKKLDEYRNTTILFIDDLFKGFEKGDYSRARTELRIMYDIINYRYDNKKAMIITTELSISKLLELDEALASRIVEMTNNFNKNTKYRFEFKGKELNYRIYGGD